MKHCALFFICAALSAALVAACTNSGVKDGAKDADKGETAANAEQSAVSLLEGASPINASSIDVGRVEAPSANAAAAEAALEELAERERSGGFEQGLGFAESQTREQSGDYAGALIAAYKELAWGYGYGAISSEKIELTLDSVKEAFSTRDYAEGLDREQIISSVNSAADGILAFIQEDWKNAEEKLSALFTDDYEADSFPKWMLMACRLESGQLGREERSAYNGIRSRYVNFPEYWYRAARAAERAGGSPSLNAAGFAERCVNLSVEGPYAAECREIIARISGLRSQDGESIKTRWEIEDTVTRSLEASDPAALSPLFPLLALPDNPYTLYAAAAMRTMAQNSLFGDYFAAQRGETQGRLQERLSYIAGGRAGAYAAF